MLKLPRFVIEQPDPVAHAIHGDSTWIKIQIMVIGVIRQPYMDSPHLIQGRLNHRYTRMDTDFGQMQHSILHFIRVNQ
jgi:hypothetical protein